MNAYIEKAIEILNQADRGTMTVPERRLYDAAMLSYRHLPQAELLHDVEETAKRINFRDLMDRCGTDHVDFTVSVGQLSRKAMVDVTKWRDAGWDAELIETERGRPTGNGSMLVYIIRVKRGNGNGCRRDKAAQSKTTTI